MFNSNTNTADREFGLHLLRKVIEEEYAENGSPNTALADLVIDAINEIKQYDIYPISQIKFASFEDIPWMSDFIKKVYKYNQYFVDDGTGNYIFDHSETVEMVNDMEMIVDYALNNPSTSEVKRYLIIIFTLDSNAVTVGVHGTSTDTLASTYNSIKTSILNAWS